MNQPLLRACAAVLAIFASTSACVPLRVTSDVSTAASAAGCHSYAWAGSFHYDNNAARSIANPLNESRLRAAIAENLAAKGVQPASGNADCLVGYGIGVHTVVEGGYGPQWGWGWGWGWGGPFGPWGWDGPSVYHQGMVAVDLFDGKSRQPLWHASVEENVTGLTGAEADQKIKAAVAAIFTKYPA
jgi:hypothetical protein